jgi:Tol biopolymer transport system component
MRGVARRVVTFAGFGGVLVLGGSALTFCGVPVPAPPPPTTTTIKATTTTRATTTTVAVTTTTAKPVIVNDPLEELISEGVGAEPSNGPSAQPAISGDGRYVAFRSTASNLVTDGTTASALYLRDRVAGTTKLIALGGDWPSLSADGRFLTFSTRSSLVAADQDAGPDIYLYDQTTGTFELISVSVTGHGSGSTASDAYESEASADGRYVVFDSNATNLVTNDVDGGTGAAAGDVFLRDRVLDTTTLVSQTIDGTGGMGFQPSMSADGQTIAFTGNGALVPGLTWSPSEYVFVYHVATATMQLVSADATGTPQYAWDAAISGDGNTVAFATTNTVMADFSPPNQYTPEVYAFDVGAQTMSLVSKYDPNQSFITPDMEPMNSSVSYDGRYVAFQCWCQRIFDGPNAGMYHLGTYRVDRATDAFEEIDANLQGVVGNKDVTLVAARHSITSDGSQVVYVSAATNLVPGDTNNYDDVFVTTPIG